MSFKFERDTYNQQADGAAHVAGYAKSAASDARQHLAGREGPLPGTTGKHPISEKIGTVITGGKQNAGTKGYLAVRPSNPPLWHGTARRTRRIVATRLRSATALTDVDTLLTMPFRRRPISSSSNRIRCAPRC